MCVWFSCSSHIKNTCTIVSLLYATKPPRTIAFQSFYNDLESSFLLASTLSHTGISSLKELKAYLEQMVQRVAGVDADTFTKMTEEERTYACQGATEEDVARINDLKKQAETYQRLGSDTAPVVLFIFLMTKFEAYIEDVTVTVCGHKPDLISLPTNATEDEIRNEVARLLANQRIDVLSEQILGNRLKIPFSQICALANTSPKELDKAKAIRNIHIHNRGFVNRRNRDRIGDAEINTYYPITMEYLEDIKDKIILSCLGFDKFVTTLYPAVLTG